MEKKSDFFKSIIDSESVIKDAHINQTRLLNSMMFCKKYDLTLKIIENIDLSKATGILGKISNYYEPIAVYLSTPKKENIGLFGIEFATDPIARFLNRFSSKEEQIMYLLAGYFLNQKMLELDKKTSIMSDKPMDEEIHELLENNKEYFDDTFMDDKLLLAYFSRINDVYHEIQSSEEYKLKNKINLLKVIESSTTNTLEIMDSKIYSVNQLIDFYKTNIMLNEDCKNIFLDVFAGFIKDKRPDFLLFIETYKSELLFNILKKLSPTIKTNLKMTALFDYNYCNKKEVLLKDITHSCITVYKKLIDSDVLDNARIELDEFNSLFGPTDIDILALSILAIFNCPDKIRSESIINKVSENIEELKEQLKFDEIKLLLNKMVGFEVDTKSIEEAIILIEAIEQFYKIVHKRMLLKKYDNNNKAPRQYEEASLTLQTQLRRSGRFELANMIAKEKYIKADTISSFAGKWKNYWSHRINKLSGSDIKRTTSIMTKIDKKVKAVVHQQMEKNKKMTDSLLDEKKVTICRSKNIDYLHIINDMNNNQ